MLDFLLASQNTPFAAALLLMLLIGGAQVAGLSDVDADHDLGDGASDGVLSLLGLGRLPLLMWVALFLMLFGVIGYAGQQFRQALTGSLASAWLAGPVAAVLSYRTQAPIIDGLVAGVAEDSPAARADSADQPRR